MPGFLRYLAIAIIASLLFFPFLGQVHLFDWDEINFAECAREMIVSKDYLRVQIDFLPFWEKPPLFIWMQVLAMKLFGINEYAARFPNALAGVATLLIIYYAGNRVNGRRMAQWWVLLYAASWLPHFYFKTGIIDPLFNLFIFCAFFQVYLLKHEPRKILHAILAGAFLGLAVLTKGPVAILVALLSFGLYIVWNKGFWGFKAAHLLVIALAAFAVTALWFGAEVTAHGWGLMQEFIVYQIRLFKTEDAGHGGPFYYHFIILLIGCFPASAFLFQYKRRRSQDSELQRDFSSWMWILFGVVLILFSIVKTKIVHYSSLCYFPLTFLAAQQIYIAERDGLSLRKGVKVLLITIGTLLGTAIALLPLVGLHKAKLIPYIHDDFAVANFNANVPWSAAESLWGICYVLGIWVGVYLLRKNLRNGIIALAIVNLVIIQVTVLHFTPKIEAFSQRAAIEYFQSLKGKDVYVQVLGYKSYAQYFYAEKQPVNNSNAHNEDWLLNGAIDKPVYFICKIMDKDKYKALPQMKYLAEKNGFVFFRRDM